jgi:glycogen(starch) synthase
MRVLYWAELFWPYVGGIEIFSTQLIPALQTYGHEFHVVTSQQSLDLPTQGEYKGTPVSRLPFQKAMRDGDVSLLLEARRQVAAIKRTFKPNLIHMNGVIPSVLFHLQTADVCPAPLLLTLHQKIVAEEPSGTETLTGRALRCAAWVNSVSSTALTQARELVPEIMSRSSVIHNGIMAPSVVPKPLPFETPRLLCLGRLATQKGFDLAVAALAAIKDRFRHAQLVIAGDGPERAKLEQQIAKLGLTGKVELVGLVAADEVPALINTATVVLMPSRFEGLPLVALQAAMMARPIVGTQVGGLPEVVVHQETGLLVEPEDSTGLAEAIAFLLEHPRTAVEMGQAGRRRVQEVFNWQRCVDRYDELYKQLMGYGPMPYAQSAV